MKRILPFLHLCLLIAVAWTSVCPPDAMGAGTTGMGTSSSPLLISSADQLADVARLVNLGKLEATVGQTTVYLKLQNDIDLAGQGDVGGWTPIGRYVDGASDKPFKGVFDGDGHAVTGLSVSRATNSCQGLFGYVSGAQIKNLGVEGVNVSGGLNSGGVCGLASGTILVNCHTSGSATGGDNTGGLVGQLFGSIVSNCYSSCTVKGDANTGGLAGCGDVASVIYSRFTGRVLVRTVLKPNLGGICGLAKNSTTIRACYVSGPVFSNDGGLMTPYGGIAGRADSGSSIMACYATDKVGAQNSFYCGGIAGQIENATVANCYTISILMCGTYYNGGVVGEVRNGGAVQNCAAFNPITDLSNFSNGMSGRIARLNGGTLLNNYGYDKMYDSWSASYPAWNFKGTNLSDGADASVTHALSAAFWKNAVLFNEAYWSLADGRLPVLKDADGTLQPGQRVDIPLFLQWDLPASFEGSGTVAAPYLIQSAADLAKLAGAVNRALSPYADAGICYRLTADIDLADYAADSGGGYIRTLARLGWIPIGYQYDAGTSFRPFKGIFDGNGKTISGMSVPDPLFSSSTVSGRGLFGALESATVKNLSVEGIRFSTIVYKTGCLAFYATNSTIQNCHLTAGAVTNLSGILGGVIAEAAESRIEACSFNGILTSLNGDLVGGIVGTMTGGSMTGCVANAEISGVSNVGGVAGKLAGTAVTNCCNTGGRVEAAGDFAGGVVGYMSGGGLTGVHYGGTVSIPLESVDGDYSEYAGGIAGYVANGLISASYFSGGTVEGYMSVGGVAGCVSGGKIERCYAKGLFFAVNSTTAGIAGSAVTADILNSYSDGTVACRTSDSDSGGIVAYASSANDIINCYSKAVVVSGLMMGGIAGYASWVSVANNVALNPRIDEVCQTANQMSGRIVGCLESPVLNSNNYGYVDMVYPTVSSATTREPGMDVAAAQALSASFWTTPSNWNSSVAISPWSGDVWQIEEGKLPVLKNVGGPQDGTPPFYLTEDSVSIYFKGSGTEASPFEITRFDQVRSLAKLVNGQETYGDGQPYATAYYKLTSDIRAVDIGGNWVPVGDYASAIPFAGVFDGNGKTIEGISIHREYNEYNHYVLMSYRGLFGYLSGATVKDLALENVSVEVASYGSGIAACADGGSTIENCHVSGAVTAESSYAGGVVGMLAGGSTVTNCSSAATVRALSYAGGIAGLVSQACIVNSENEGLVTGTASCIGGIAGRAESSSTLMLCSSPGMVTGTGSAGMVGGIAGAVDGSLIRSCYSAGDVAGTNRVGGVAGYITGRYNSAYTVFGCYSDGDVSGAASVGGVVGMADGSSKVSDCYAKGNVSAIAGPAGGLVGTVTNSAAVTDSYSMGAVSGGGRVGGVVGAETSCLVQSSVALNLLVSGTSIVGRVVGEAGGVPGLSNIYAFEGLLDKNGGASWPAESRNGTSVTASQIATKTFWANTVTLDASVWVLADSKLPLLKDLDGVLLPGQDDSLSLGYVCMSAGELSISPVSKELPVSDTAQTVTFTVTGMENWTFKTVQFTSTAGSVSSTVNGTGTLSVPPRYLGSVTVTATNPESGKTVSATVTTSEIYGMTVDQANNNFGYYFNNRTWGWQSFTAGTNGYLSAVQLWLYSTGAGAGYSGGGSWSASLLIREGEGVTGKVLASQTISGDGVFQQRTFALETPVRMAAGNVYTICFENATAGLTVRASGNVYAGGRCHYSANYDYNFCTYWVSTDWSEERYRDIAFTASSTVISNEAQLAQFAYLVNSGSSYSGRSVTLAADLDLSEHYWTPIGSVNADGTPSAAFGGRFDGNGKTVSGVYVNSGTNRSVGFFGAVSGAHIVNLALRDVDIAGPARAGGLVGYAFLSYAINDAVSGAVAGGTCAGGVAGEVAGTNALGHVWNCWSDARVSGAGLVGGLSGCASAAGTVVGRNSYWKNTGAVPYDVLADGGAGVNLACCSFGEAPGVLAVAGTPGLSEELNAFVMNGSYPGLYGWTAGSTSNYPSMIPLIRVEGAYVQPHTVSDLFTAGLTLDQVDDTVDIYTQAHPGTDAEAFGETMGQAEALGFTFAELSAGNAILGFEPSVRVTAFDPVLHALTFTIGNGIDATAVDAMNRLAQSSEKALSVVQSPRLGDAGSATTPSAQYFADGTAVATFAPVAVTNTMFYKLQINHR